MGNSKQAILSALLDFLAAAIADAEKILATKEEGSIRIFISDNKENMKALRASNSAEALQCLRMIKKGVHIKDEEFNLIVADVPHPLPPAARLLGEDYVLARMAPYEKHMKPGFVWIELRGHRDETLEITSVLRLITDPEQ